MVKHRIPHDADLCDVLGDWVQSDNMRAQILVSNPAQLYGF
jgi:2-pyrone-4,6-dicarboxylate lactonase